MRDLTLVLPYYENPTMLVRQQAEWSSYSDDLKSRLHVVVVDDGSPEHPARSVWKPAGLASSALYRCLVDVRWNWLFCRNLAVSKATTEWVLMTDIDHVLPATTLRSLLTRELNPRRAYRLSRVDAPDLTPYKPHPNTWLMTRVLFDRIGGYDERFSGFYGTDGEFRDRVLEHAKVEMLPDLMVRYPREVIADASTTRYGRKEPHDKPNVKRIIAERGPSGLWETQRLTFPWERVA